MSSSGFPIANKNDFCVMWYQNSNHENTYYGQKIFKSTFGYKPCKEAFLSFIKSQNDTMPLYKERWEIYGYKSWEHFKGVIEAEIALATDAINADA